MDKPFQYLHGKNLSECVGRVCFAWSDIEWQIEELMISSSGLLDPTLVGDWPDHLQNIYASYTSIRNQIPITKAILHEAKRKDSPRLFSKAEKLLNFIDNELRYERNRYVHDQWYGHNGKLHATKFKISISKPQSHKTELKFSETKSFNGLNEVNNFIDLLNCCNADLRELILHIDGLFYVRWQNAERAPRLPAHWSYKTHLNKLAQEKQPLQPQSSPL